MLLVVVDASSRGNEDCGDSQRILSPEDEESNEAVDVVVVLVSAADQNNQN
jgi:hypothetical protein